jgi:hypothetical protein
MTGTILTALANTLLTNVVDVNGKPIFQTVELWANQVEHELAEINDEKPRLLPACYIEFADVEEDFQNNQRVLQKNFKTILHIVFHSLKDNDATYLDIKQACYQFVQWFEAGTCSKFQWKAEITNTDVRNLRWFQQIYFSTLKDFSAVQNPNTGTVTTLTINPIIVPSI